MLPNGVERVRTPHVEQLGIIITDGVAQFIIPGNYIQARGMLQLLTEAIEAKSPFKDIAKHTPPEIAVPDPQTAKKLVG